MANGDITVVADMKEIVATNVANEFKRDTQRERSHRKECLRSKKKTGNQISEPMENLIAFVLSIFFDGK